MYSFWLTNELQCRAFLNNSEFLWAKLKNYEWIPCIFGDGLLLVFTKTMQVIVLLQELLKTISDLHPFVSIGLSPLKNYCVQQSLQAMMRWRLKTQSKDISAERIKKNLFFNGKNTLKIIILQNSPCSLNYHCIFGNMKTIWVWSSRLLVNGINPCRLVSFYGILTMEVFFMPKHTR